MDGSVDVDGLQPEAEAEVLSRLSGRSPSPSHESKNDPPGISSAWSAPGSPSSPVAPMASALAQEAAELEQKVASLRTQVSLLEGKGRGLADAQARLARELKLRTALESEKTALGGRLESLKAELRTAEGAKMAADKTATDNADIANAWKERCEGYEAAYESLKKEFDELQTENRRLQAAPSPQPSRSSPSASAASPASQAAAIEAASAAAAAAAVAELQEKHAERFRDLERQVAMLRSEAEQARAAASAEASKSSIWRAHLSAAHVALATHLGTLERLVAEGEAAIGHELGMVPRDELKAALAFSTSASRGLSTADEVPEFPSALHAAIQRTTGSCITSIVRAVNEARSSVADARRTVESSAAESRNSAEARISEAKRQYDALLEERNKLVREWEGYASHWETRGRAAEKTNAEWESSFDALQLQYAAALKAREEALTDAASARASLKPLRHERDALKAEVSILSDYLRAVGHSAALSGISRGIAASVAAAGGAAAATATPAAAAAGPSDLEAAIADSTSLRQRALMSASAYPAAELLRPGSLRR